MDRDPGVSSYRLRTGAVAACLGATLLGVPVSAEPTMPNDMTLEQTYPLSAQPLGEARPIIDQTKPTADTGSLTPEEHAQRWKARMDKMAAQSKMASLILDIWSYGIPIQHAYSLFDIEDHNGDRQRDILYAEALGGSKPEDFGVRLSTYKSSKGNNIYSTTLRPTPLDCECSNQYHWAYVYETPTTTGNGLAVILPSYGIEEIDSRESRINYGLNTWVIDKLGHIVSKHYLAGTYTGPTFYSPTDIVTSTYVWDTVPEVVGHPSDIEPGAEKDILVTIKDGEMRHLATTKVTDSLESQTAVINGSRSNEIRNTGEPVDGEVERGFFQVGDLTGDQRQDVVELWETSDSSSESSTVEYVARDLKTGNIRWRKPGDMGHWPQEVGDLTGDRKVEVGLIPVTIISTNPNTPQPAAIVSIKNGADGEKIFEHAGEQLLSWDDLDKDKRQEFVIAEAQNSTDSFTLKALVFRSNLQLLRTLSYSIAKKGTTNYKGGVWYAGDVNGNRTQDLALSLYQAETTSETLPDGSFSIAYNVRTIGRKVADIVLNKYYSSDPDVQAIYETLQPAGDDEFLRRDSDVSTLYIRDGASQHRFWQAQTVPKDSKTYVWLFLTGRLNSGNCRDIIIQTYSHTTKAYTLTALSGGDGRVLWSRNFGKGSNAPAKTIGRPTHC